MIGFFFAILMTVGVASPQPASAKERAFRIGVSQCSDDEWRQSANYGMLQEATYYGYDITFRSANDDAQTQINDIKKLVDSGIDLLIVSPVESSLLTPIVTEVYQSGLPVILYDRTTDNDQYTAFIGADNYEIGHIAGEYLNSALSGKGDILVIRGTPGSSADQQRYRGFMDVVRYIKGIRITDELNGNFTKNDALSQVSAYIESIDSSFRVDAIYSLNDRMAEGALNAFMEHGDSTRPVMIGTDAQISGLEDVVSGRLDATIMYPNGSSDVIDLARNILLGKPFSKDNKLSTYLVDRSNARMLLSQARQIDEKREQLDELTKRVNKFSEQNGRQALMLEICVVLLGLVLILLYMMRKSVAQRTKLNDKLNVQNEDMKRQVETLEQQKKELVVLSHKLEQTTQAKISFFTNISHEFKTPLSLISGPIEDLEKMKGLPPEAGPKIDILKRNNSKLSRLINELLDFRAVETGNVSVNYSTGDIKVFLGDIIKMFDNVVKSRNLNFSYLTEGDDFTLPFDPVKMEKIFTNLLSNAFNHVDRQGTIVVRLKVQGDETRHILLSVFNSGSYISPEQRPKIFRQFYTLDKEQKGTGIGLALVADLVNLLQGSLDLESDKDKGTTFTVDIPIEKSLITDSTLDNANYQYNFARLKYDTIGEQNDRSGVYDEAYKGTLPVALVIEDNVDMRQYLSSVLSSEYHVMLARDGEVGVKKAELYKPDIIICDIMMPVKDGYEVCKELSANQQLASIPIILLTACSMEEQKVKGYESGAAGYLQKPFSVATLKAMMKSLREKAKIADDALSETLIPNMPKDQLSSASVKLLESIEAYVDRHLSEEISIDDMITELGFSKSKFYRDIKEASGEYSITDIVNLARLRKAIKIMASGEKNVSETAFMCGFSSASYFTRIFRKYYGDTPKNYMKMRFSAPAPADSGESSQPEADA